MEHKYLTQKKKGMNESRNHYQSSGRKGLQEMKKELHDELHGKFSPRRFKRRTNDRMAKHYHSKRKDHKNREYSVRRAMRGTYIIPENQTDVLLEFRKRSRRFKFEGSFTGNFNVGAQETSNRNPTTDSDDLHTPTRRRSKSCSNPETNSLDDLIVQSEMNKADLRERTVVALHKAAEVIGSYAETNSPGNVLEKTQETLNDFIKNAEWKRQIYDSKEGQHKQNEESKELSSVSDYSVVKNGRYPIKSSNSSGPHPDLKLPGKFQRSTPGKSINIADTSTGEEHSNKELSSIKEDLAPEDIEESSNIKLEWEHFDDKVLTLLKVEGIERFDQKVLQRQFREKRSLQHKTQVLVIKGNGPVNPKLFSFLVGEQEGFAEDIISTFDELWIKGCSFKLEELDEVIRKLPKLQMLVIDRVNILSSLSKFIRSPFLSGIERGNVKFEVCKLNNFTFKSKDIISSSQSEITKFLKKLYTSFEKFVSTKIAISNSSIVESVKMNILKDLEANYHTQVVCEEESITFLCQSTLSEN
ncbi:unnamed protein product [Moneuplotes crassus]|uniref:Uncharacterized protein n=1 Tax=Euplotes crassus TaxID=5936 RepID=A0AAD1XB55_EUPCR|nr:unnamed protein product [Moneuplotes crassus]